MTAPVICADQTIGDGLVTRWRFSTDGPAALSASRSPAMVHGSVSVDDDLRLRMTGAPRGRKALRAGRDGEARALATHEYDRAFFGDLVPVARKPDHSEEPS